MGYNPTPLLVHEYAPVLELMYQFINAGNGPELLLEVSSSAEIYKEQYRIRRALKAADVFTSEKNGRYAGLGDQVQIGVDTNRMRIVVKRTAAPPTVTVHAPHKDENDAIKQLQTADNKLNMTMLDFYPSDAFNLDSFKEDMDEIGWQVNHVMTNPDNEEELLIGAERKARGADIMEQLGFRRKTS